MKKSSLIDKIKLFLILICLSTSCLSCALGGVPVNQYQDGVIIESDGTMVITQYGISWCFDTEYQWGKFANGDYWVVGPVKIIAIYPVSTMTNGRIINGSMLNPSPVADATSTHRYDQGFDSNCGNAAPYNPDLNAARPGGIDLSSTNPLTITTGSLISSVSIRQKQWPQLKTAAVLTIVSHTDIPTDGSFRPPYSGTDKTIRFNKSMLQYNLLKKLVRPASTTGDTTDDVNLTLPVVEKFFERVWIDFRPAFDNQPIQPADNMPGYGREMSICTGQAALFLHLNYTDAEKEKLLIRFVQRGIDLYGITQNGGKFIWYNQGGHALGRKWAIIFAGLMLGDSAMQNIGQKSGDYLYTSPYGPGNGNQPPDYIFFSEDDQTFYVSQADIDWTHNSDPNHPWNPDKRNVNYAPYTSSDLGVAEWAIDHATEPWRSDQNWGAEYRSVTAVSWAGWILAARIMGAQSLWNHNVLFEYQDRYMAVTASSTKYPAWRTAVNANISSAWSSQIQAWWGQHPGGRQYSPFVETMWDEYRDDY